MDTNTSLLLAKGVGLEQNPTALSFSVCTGACQIKCLLLVLAAGSTLGVHIKNFHFDITPFLCERVVTHIEAGSYSYLLAVFGGLAIRYVIPSTKGTDPKPR